jgi:hypothetical protein
MPSSYLTTGASLNIRELTARTGIAGRQVRCRPAGEFMPTRAAGDRTRTAATSTSPAPARIENLLHKLLKENTDDTWRNSR